MSQKVIPPPGSSRVYLVPGEANKDEKHRLSRFAAWLDEQGRSWATPDLAAYRDCLAETGYAPATISAHLSTVRSRYQALIRQRDLFFEIAPATDAQGRRLSPADRKALVDELIVRLENAISPAAAPVKLTARQDRADTEQLRLTADQARALMNRPDLDNLIGLRDTTLIALMLCTGIREAELCALDVVDLRQRLGGELALRVRQGKGDKQRLIPYGGLAWVLVLLDHWLERAGIKAGPVFRGLYKGGRRLRPGRLSVRAVQHTLKRYPIVIEGKLRTVTPHDLRRTYARRLYVAGMRLETIQQNLGHKHPETTQGYIGTLDAAQRKPPRVYDFDLSRLARTAR